MDFVTEPALPSATVPNREQLRSRIAHAIATIVLSGPLFGYGLWCIVHRRCFIPLSRRHWFGSTGITLTGTAAVTAGIALLIAAIGVVVHIWLSGFDQRGHVVARLCGAVALVMFIWALVIQAMS